MRGGALPSYGGYNGFMLSRGDEGYLAGNHVVALNGGVGLTHWGLDCDTGVPLPLVAWHHVAATWDGSTESLHLDGHAFGVADPGQLCANRGRQQRQPGGPMEVR